MLGDALALFSEQFFLPYDERVLECEPTVEPMFSEMPASPFMERVKEIEGALEKYGRRGGVYP
jgi:hypothetical protein